jgi:hypothetical protein
LFEPDPLGDVSVPSGLNQPVMPAAEDVYAAASQAWQLFE